MSFELSSIPVQWIVGLSTLLIFVVAMAFRRGRGGGGNRRGYYNNRGLQNGGWRGGRGRGRGGRGRGGNRRTQRSRNFANAGFNSTGNYARRGRNHGGRSGRNNTRNDRVDAKRAAAEALLGQAVIVTCKAFEKLEVRVKVTLRKTARNPSTPNSRSRSTTRLRVRKLTPRTRHWRDSTGCIRKKGS